MRYINPKSKRGLVNKFAEFILSELNKNKNHKTKIEVSLFDAFFVINGKTESQNLVDMSDVQKRFYDINKELFEHVGIKNINTIDIIKYNTLPDIPSEQHFDFYDSNRPVFNRNVIDLIKNIKQDYLSINYTDKVEVETFNEITSEFTTYSSGVITSEFPYGYSLNTNRAYLYYSEYITNQLFKVCLCDKIVFKYSTNFNEELNDIMIDVESDSIFSDKDLKSLVLDVFDFNLNNFIVTKLSKLDFNSSIDSQLEKSDWLVMDKINDLNLF